MKAELIIIKKLREIKSIEKWPRILFVLLPFSLPFDQRISTILLIITTFVSLIFLLRHYSSPPRIVLLFFTLFLLYCISWWFGLDHRFKFIEQRASLIAIPLVFWAFQNQLIYLSKKVTCSFVIGNLIVAVFCLIFATYRSLVLVDGEIRFTPSVNKEFSFWYSVIRDGNYFFSDHLSLFHQSTYFSVYLNISIAIILFDHLKWSKTMKLVVVIFFGTIIFLLSNKMGILILFLTMILATYKSVKSKTKFLFVLTLLALVFTLAIYINPRGNVMISEFKANGLEINPANRYDYQLRLMTWDAAIRLIKHYPVIGVGVSNTQEKLNEMYEHLEYQTPLQVELNAHNQYFQTYLELGFPGFVILCCTLMYMLFQNHSVVRNQLLSISVLGIFAFSFLFESCLNRYSGISAFTFFLCLFCLSSRFLNSYGKDC